MLIAKFPSSDVSHQIDARGVPKPHREKKAEDLPADKLTKSPADRIHRANKISQKVTK